MTVRAPPNAEILLKRDFERTELRALRATRRGRVRLFLEVNATRLSELLDPDDDRQLYRCTEFDTEPELVAAFERAAGALAH
jgi:hypothetical protein